MEYKILSHFIENDLIIDGRLSSDLWNKTPEISLNYYDGTPVSNQWSTKVKSLWTTESLYFGFDSKFQTIRIADSSIKTTNDGKTPELWDLSDVFEIFIGPESKITKKYIEVQVGPDSRWIDLTLDASGKERLADFEWRSYMTARSFVDHEKKIWTAVFKIPFSAFSKFPNENDVWNCNFYRISGEVNEKIYLAWSPVGVTRFHQPDKYGDIVFVK